MMKTKIIAIVAAALMVIGVTPQKASAGDANVFGTVIGAATGGFVGSHMGRGDGRLAATAAGTLLGALIGHELGTAADAQNRYETRHGTVYGKPRYSRPVYNRTVYQPVRVAPPPAPRRKVVVHKHKVTVKHVYADRDDRWSEKKSRKKQWKKRQARKRQWEQRRRELARACYEHPRRCAQAF